MHTCLGSVGRVKFLETVLSAHMNLRLHGIDVGSSLLFFPSAFTCRSGALCVLIGRDKQGDHVELIPGFSNLPLCSDRGGTQCSVHAVTTPI